MRQIREHLSVVEKAIDLNALLQEIVSSQAYATAAKHFPKIVMARNEAVDELDKVDVEPIANSVSAVEKVRSMAQAATQSSLPSCRSKGSNRNFLRCD